VHPLNDGHWQGAATSRKPPNFLASHSTNAAEGAAAFGVSRVSELQDLQACTVR
jgi:hypothetical protein